MLRLNIFNATTIVPTLARIILCAAFLSMGWNKLMHTHEFTGDNAQTLIDLGIVDAPPNTTVTPASWLVRDDDSNNVDEAPADQPPTEPPGEPDGEPILDVPEVDIPDIPEPPGDVLRTDPATGEVIIEAKRLHTVTLAVENAGWAQPVTMAWLATLTELIGGALLLLGLFSRVWGLGLAVAMGVAFYLTSLPALLDMGLFAIAADMTGGYAAYNRMFVQLALGTLALGVFLTGPGPLSLDRLLFRPNHPKDPELDDVP